MKLFSHPGINNTFSFNPSRRGFIHLLFAGSGAAALQVMTGATTVRWSDCIRKVASPDNINQKS